LLVIFQSAIRNPKSKMENGCLAWLRSRSSGVRDRRTPDYATRPAVALCAMVRQAIGSPSRNLGEGWSPGKVLPLRLLAGGRPDVILFHHRAEIGCGKWVRTIDFAFKERRVADYSIPQGFS